MANLMNARKVSAAWRRRSTVSVGQDLEVGLALRAARITRIDTTFASSNRE
jgi:hypothetical protein